MTNPERPLNSWDQVDHSLFKRLQLLDREIAQLLPDNFDPGLGSVGLILDSNPDESRYISSTPTHCRTFARTGGEGVHFSFLLVEGSICETSPVVVTIPVMETSFIVGESLYDFLCLGAQRGVFALEQLAYELELTLEVFTNPSWKPSTPSHRSAGYVPDRNDRQILHRLREQFGLHPWPNSTRFHELQDRYRGAIEPPNSGSP